MLSIGVKERSQSASRLRSNSERGLRSAAESGDEGGGRREGTSTHRRPQTRYWRYRKRSKRPGYPENFGVTQRDAVLGARTRTELQSSRQANVPRLSP